MSNLQNPKWTKTLYGMERATLYPYESPKINFLIKKGVLKNLPTDYDFSNRIPVLAIGSNRNPAQIIRKFGNENEIPVTNAILKNCDVIHSSLISYYGAVPATIWPSSGSRVNLSINWLNDLQLKKMHETEAVGKAYDFVVFDDETVILDDYKNSSKTVYGYVAISGGLKFDDSMPRALSAISNQKRTLKNATQEEAIKKVASYILEKVDQNKINIFRERIITDENYRYEIYKNLESLSIKYKNFPWKNLSIKKVNSENYF